MCTGWCAKVNPMSSWAYKRKREAGESEEGKELCGWKQRRRRLVFEGAGSLKEGTRGHKTRYLNGFCVPEGTRTDRKQHLSQSPQHLDFSSARPISNPDSIRPVVICRGKGTQVLSLSCVRFSREETHKSLFNLGICMIF